MNLTAQLKLLPTVEQAKALRATVREVNAAANFISELAFEAQVFRRFALHHVAYRQTRERFDLSADMTCAALGKVANAYKLDRRCQRRFRPLGAIPYTRKVFAFGEESVSIWTVAGRQTIPFACGDRQRRLLERTGGHFTLRERGGNFYLSVTCEVEEPTAAIPAEWLGIDLGVVYIATDSDGECHAGAELVGLRKRHARQRSRLQSKGTRSAKRRARQRSGKEARLARDINHCISKRIVREAERTGRGIALEDLKGIRGRIRARRSQRRTLHSWAFHQLGSFIEYKAALAGVPVVMIDPAMTSRTCPECGHCAKANRPQRDNFTCRRCGLAGPADHIAARNIAGRAAAVQPHAASSGIAASRPSASAHGERTHGAPDA